MKYNDADGVWRTIHGRRVFIKNGQSLEDAMKESGKFEKSTAKKQEKEEAKKAEETPKEQPKLYVSAFRLEAPVNDYDEAQAYLQSDDMTQYVPEELKDVITSAQWELEDEEQGFVNIRTNRELTPEEKKSLRDWIDGQNSDGLGEGFEQQPFAESYFNPDTGEGPFTYSEYEEELQREYDELDPSEYADYLPEESIETAIDQYLDENGYEADDEEAREEARDAILSDPEEYLDYDDIGYAKDEYFKDYGSREQDWYVMSSMRRYGDDFEEEDITPTNEKAVETLKEGLPYLDDKTAQDYVDKLESNAINNQTNDEYEGLTEKQKQLIEMKKSGEFKELLGDNDEASIKEAIEKLRSANENPTEPNYERSEYNEWADKENARRAEEYKQNADELRNAVEGTHTNVFNRSDGEIDDAINAFNDFKEYEKFSPDEWNSANQEKRDELAKDALRKYINDARPSLEEVRDLADVMENENHHTEARWIEEVYNEKSESHRKLEREMGEELIEHTNDEGKHWYSSKSISDEEKRIRDKIESEKTASKNITDEDKEMLRSIYAYSKETAPQQSKYYKDLENKYGKEAVEKEYKALQDKYDIVGNTYTDSEGVTYNTLKEKATSTNTLESRYPVEKGQTGKEYIRTSHPYSEVEYAYAKKNDDGSWSVLDPTKKYGNRTYQEHIYNTVEEAREKMAEIDGRIGADTKNAGRNYEGVSYNNYDRESVTEGTIDHRGKERQQENWEKQMAKEYGTTESKKSNARWTYEGWGEDYHKQDGDTYSQIIASYSNGSSKPTKQGDTLKYYRTDYKIDRDGEIDYTTAVKTEYNSLAEAKKGETTNQSMNNAIREKASKRVAEADIKEKGYEYYSRHGLGPGTLPKDVNTGGTGENENGWTKFKTDRPLTSEELKKYDIQSETKNSEIKSNNDRINDTLRKKAYQKYMKEHPNSKKTLEDFLKKK